MTTIIVPVEIGRANEHDVKILWSDGKESIYPARALRLACPCAACVDELTGEIRLIPSSVPQDVRPMKVELIGRYAISVRWSDGHATGIYSFEKLRGMAGKESGRIGGQGTSGSSKRQE